MNTTEALKVASAELDALDTLLDDAKRAFHNSQQWSEDGPTFDGTGPTYDELIAEGFNKVRSALAALSAASSEQPVMYISKTGHGTRYRETLDEVDPAYYPLWTPLYSAPQASQPVSALTDEQVDRCRKLTLDYAIAVFDAAGGRMVNTSWVVQRLGELKDLPLDTSVILSATSQPSAWDAAIEAAKRLMESRGGKMVNASWAAEAIEGLRQQAPAVQEAQAPVVTEEMVTAYLAANTSYWQQQDELPLKNPAKWRNGTPQDATRFSLEAALRAAYHPAPAQPQEPLWHANGKPNHAAIDRYRAEQAAPAQTAPVNVPSGWDISVQEDDEESWLRVTSPNGPQVAFSVARGTFRAQVLQDFGIALSAAPSAPIAANSDAKRLDYVLNNDEINVAGTDEGGWIVWDASNGLSKIAEGKTARVAIDAAIAATAQQKGGE